MPATLVLDQPDLIAPPRTRRMEHGTGPRIAILNARGARFEGGGDEPDLSLKWIPRGRALYRVGRTSFDLKRDAQLLLNRGQSYSLAMREPSESFVVFFARAHADAAWRSYRGRDEGFPEVPTVAGLSHPALAQSLAALHGEARREIPDLPALEEGALALLGEIASLAHERRRMVTRLPALRRTTREELLRRVARAESCLLECDASLDDAAQAAALSPFHLIRVFRAVHGETPLAWAAGRRLDGARDALCLTDDRIAEVALRAGYASRTAFDRAFRRRFGETPGSIRARR
jgi:AraC-like DNA-binding protein